MNYYVLLWVNSALFLALGSTALVSFFRLRRTISSLGYTHHSSALESSQTPTVSVCIPARNEAHAMTLCLEKVLASDYQKLEILVLDDGSQDDTGTLIRAFARDGVRFIGVQDLPGGWFGKNFALERLAREASGDVILFLDVDTQLSSTTISRMVNALKQQDAEMISVLPKNTKHYRMSDFFDTLRRFWQLLFHTSNAPIASSSAWLISRTLLQQHDYFLSMKSTMSPENYFAKYASFNLFLDDYFGVFREKSRSAQKETSVRTLAPFFGCAHTKRQAAALFYFFLGLSLCWALLFCGGFLGLFSEVGSEIKLIVATTFIFFQATLFLLFSLYQKNTHPATWRVSSLLFGIIFFQEALLFLRSMQLYALGKVTWKGRSISR